MHGFASYRCFEKARFLRNDRNVHVLGHYVLTKLGSKLGRYVRVFGRYVRMLGRYVATELGLGSVAT